jgi:hypothetical protein
MKRIKEFYEKYKSYMRNDLLMYFLLIALILFLFLVIGAD